MPLIFLTLFSCANPSAPMHPGDDEPFVLEVPQGSTANGLAPRLEEAGLLPSGLLPAALQWKLFLRSTDASCLKAGKFSVHRAMSLEELLSTLCGVPLSDDVPFTVLEGWRIRDIDAALTEKGWIDAGMYKAVAHNPPDALAVTVTGSSLEGYLFPETYRVDPDRFDVEDFITRQVQTFHDRFVEPQQNQFGDRSLHEVVIMASLLEREEPKPSQRPLVAGILYKRLAHDWALGVDATSRYTLKDWNDRRAFLKKLRDPDDPYNTRLHKGMPPTAIGNPSLDSLRAALAPETSPYWYYLHDHNKVLRPSRNAAEHEAKRAQYDVY